MLFANRRDFAQLWNMKKISLITALILLALTSYLQGQIQLTVRWNTNLNRYEVFMKPNFTASKNSIGPTQISIVVPSDAPDESLQITSRSIGFSDADIITSPISAPNSDFHGLGSIGGKIDLFQNQESLLFSFIFSDNKCREGVRLFNNETDPDSKAPGMGGADFSNSIYGFNLDGLNEIYSSNYNNFGTVCTECKDKILVPFIIKKKI